MVNNYFLNEFEKQQSTKILKIELKFFLLLCVITSTLNTIEFD